LLAKDKDRPSDADEMEESRPKVPLVSKPLSFACLAERLARAGAGPDGPVVRPAGQAQGVGPCSDAGEEMALKKPGKVIWNDILDSPLINFPGRDVSGLDQFPQPGRGEWVVVVIVGGHWPDPALVEKTIKQGQPAKKPADQKTYNKNSPIRHEPKTHKSPT
jgi:hypothetical protein